VSRKWPALLVVCAAAFMLMIDLTVAVVAAPAIQGALHARLSDVQWVINAYALALAAVVLVSGSVADLYGRKRVFVAGLVVFTLASLLCALAQSPLTLILWRVAQGVGGAAIYSTSLAIMAHSFRGRARAMAIGLWGAVSAVGVSLGPVIGGVLTSDLSWRGIFLINVPVGAVTLAVTIRHVEESRQSGAPRPDWPGGVTLTAGVVGLVYGIMRASQTAWSDAGVIIALSAGAGLLALFIAVELRTAHPLFDLSLFRVPSFAGVSIAALAVYGSIIALYIYLSIYLQDGLGFSAVGAGLRLLTCTVPLLVTSIALSRLRGRVPARWLIGGGLVVIGLGLLSMRGLDAATPWTHLIPGLILTGIGGGAVVPQLSSTVIGVVRPERSGSAAGMNLTIRQVSMALSISVLGCVYAAVIRDSLAAKLPAPAPAAAQAANEIVQGGFGGQKGIVPAAAVWEQLVAAARAGFATGLNDLLVITAIIALAGGACAFVLVRDQDFLARDGDDAAEQSAADRGVVSTGGAAH
jgi:EmrB/QacA subfamily drug resistance transporter